AGIVFHRDAGRLLAVAEDPALALGDRLVAKLARRHAVAPVAERTLGKLHDVALVHQRHAAPLLAQRVVDRGGHQALGAFGRYRLDADAAGGGKADLRHLHLALEEGNDLLRLGALRLPLDAGVDVLGVLAEDDDVDLLGAPHRARHAVEVAHRPQADVQIEQLAQRDVERANAAADRSGERPLDAYLVRLERPDRLVRQPILDRVERLLAGEHFLPHHAPLAAVYLLHCRVEDALRRAPDVGPGTIALDEGNDRCIGYLQLSAH